MFTNNLKERNQHEIILQEIHGDYLKVLIDFCYSGLMDINPRNVYQILETSTRLEFIHIETKCRIFLLENLKVSNCLSMWTSLENFLNFEELSQSALQIAKQNFADVIEQDAFLLLSVNHVFELLGSEELNVWSEEEVFNALTKWINYEETERKQHAVFLLSSIRLTELRSEVSDSKVIATEASVKFIGSF